VTSFILTRLRWLLRRPDPVVREWEWYARRHRRTRSPAHLGEEWNVPRIIGLDHAPGDEVVASIDRAVLEPHLGRVGTVLEIGAGGGRFTQALLYRARQVIASDPSPTMIRLLLERFRGVPQVRPLLLDGRGLASVADGSIDAVFAYDVFIHLSPWISYVYLEEIRRALKPGGKAILHHANTFSALGWRRFLSDAERARAGLPAQAQFSPMTPAFMSELARRAGLVVHEVVTNVVRRDCVSILGRPR
jgi:SAM-dependent methyltransferase